MIFKKEKTMDNKNNTGSDNTGYGNSGYRNSGNRNSGNRNSGSGNSGYWNSGNGNSGNRNSGNRNSGNRNSGSGNSGYWNSGYENSGSGNSGNWNSGYGNSTNRSAGIFCNQEPKVISFNKPTDIAWDKINHPRFGPFYLNKWIDESEMTDVEKVEQKDFHVRGGYLKTYEWKEAWANYWRDADEAEKQRVLGLPNFDAEVFKDITGIDIGKKEVSCNGKVVKIEGEEWEEVAPASPLPPGFEHYRFLKKVEKRSPLEEWRDNKFSNLSDLEEELINQTANWLVDTLVGKPLYPYLAKDVASIKSFQAGINAVLDEAKRLIGRV